MPVVREQPRRQQLQREGRQVAVVLLRALLRAGEEGGVQEERRKRTRKSFSVKDVPVIIEGQVRLVREGGYGTETVEGEGRRFGLLRVS